MYNVIHACWCSGDFRRQGISKHGTLNKLEYSVFHIRGVNSLPHGKCGCDFKCVIFKPLLVSDIVSISSEIAIRWMPHEWHDLTDDNSTLVQVMAWCHQATSHYLSQCWPRSLLPYGITRPQWVNLLIGPHCTALQWQRNGSTLLVEVMDCFLTVPLPEPMLTY